MGDRLFGVETEYAVAGLGARGASLERRAVVDAILSQARHTLPHIPDGSQGGMFLANGARFYLDCGLHPEMTTPECSTPWEVVRYILAGEHILLTLAAGRDPFARRRMSIALYRCNVDYSGSRATWGCHESYMHRIPPRLLPAHIMPHLVSRLIYSGAGGFNNLSPGIEFTLSPRVPHMTTEVSHNSTQERGIFHTKDEPLSGGGAHRLHLLCGESLCSQTATFLKIGTTVLVVALIEAGAQPSPRVALKDPLKAMNVFASDPTCTLAVETADGRHLRAIDVQRHYLELVERQLSHPCMPSWAEACCLLWGSILDQLEGGVSAVATVLDWAIKLPIYKEHARRRGWAWETLVIWNQALSHLTLAQQRAGGPHEIGAGILSAPDGPVRTEMRRLVPFLNGHGMSWNLLPAFLDLRRELFEIDLRFGQIGAAGIFTQLDEAGVLAHQVAGVDNIEQAAEHPPALGRARVRGTYVRQLGAEARTMVCNWCGIWDSRSKRTVDLRDPFVSHADWGTWIGPAPLGAIAPAGGSTLELAREQVEREQLVGELEQRGDYAAAEPLRRQSIVEAERRWGAEHPETALLCNQLSVILRNLGRPSEAEPWCRRALRIDQTARGIDHPKIPHRLNNLALVLVMQGKLTEARQRLARAWALKTGRHDITSARVLWTRIAAAFLGGEVEAPFIGLMKSLLSLRSLPFTGGVISRWQVAAVVDFIRPRITPAAADLLLQLAEVLNDRRRLHRLDVFPLWADRAALPLDTAWPQEEEEALPARQASG